MKIRTVEYAGTIVKPDAARPGSLPQIAFSGRSNVGKSSLINVLLQRTRNKIARVSATSVFHAPCAKRSPARCAKGGASMHMGCA